LVGGQPLIEIKEEVLQQDQSQTTRITLTTPTSVCARVSSRGRPCTTDLGAEMLLNTTRLRLYLFTVAMFMSKSAAMVVVVSPCTKARRSRISS
jgi:hypothetical protein